MGDSHACACAGSRAQQPSDAMFASSDSDSVSVALGLDTKRRKGGRGAYGVSSSLTDDQEDESL